MTEGRNGGIPFTSYSKCDDVWFWGNPLLEDNPSYAVFLYDNVSYHVLAQVTATQYRITRKRWKQALFRYKTSIDELIELVQYYHDAMKVQSDNPIRYVANRMNKTELRIQALKLLVDMDSALDSVHLYPKYEENSKKAHVVNRQAHSPDSTQVSQIMATIPHICPAGYEGCIGEFVGRFDLCVNCYKKLGSHNPAKWDSKTQEWLPQMVDAIRSQWRKSARNIWYKQNHSELPDLDIDYIDAA